MKHILFIVVFFFCLNANAAIYNVNWVSGSPANGAKSSNPVCPSNSVCYDIALSAFPDWQILADAVSLSFLQYSADVTINWWYKNANPNLEVSLTGITNPKATKGLTDESGSFSYSIGKSGGVEFGMSMANYLNKSELGYQIAFSNIVMLDESEPTTIQPIPLPSALSLIMPFLLAFSLKKKKMK